MRLKNSLMTSPSGKYFVEGIVFHSIGVLFLPDRGI